MKKIIAFLSFFICTSTIVGQKISVDKVDAFTGNRIVETSSVTLKRNGLASGFAVCFISVDNRIFLKMYLDEDDRVAYHINEGDKLLLKLTDGNLVELKSLWDVVASNNDNDVPQNSNKIRKWELTSVYSGDFTPVTETNLITNIRLYKSNGYTDYKVNEKRAKQVQKAYQLLVDKVGTDGMHQHSSSTESFSNSSDSDIHNAPTTKTPISEFWDLQFGQNEDSVRSIISIKGLDEISIDSAGVTLDLEECQHSISFKKPKMNNYVFDACLLTFLNNRLQSVAFNREFVEKKEFLVFFEELKQILDFKYGTSIEIGAKERCLVWNDGNSRVVSLMTTEESEIAKVVLYYKNYGLEVNDKRKVDFSDF